MKHLLLNSIRNTNTTKLTNSIHMNFLICTYVIGSDFLCDTTPLYAYGYDTQDPNFLSTRIRFEYQTKASRFQQFTGFIELINSLDSLDDACRYYLFTLLCSKTFMLLRINYSKDENWTSIVTECRQLCEHDFTLIHFTSYHYDKRLCHRLLKTTGN